MAQGNGQGAEGQGGSLRRPAAKLLQRYLYYFRAEPVIVDRFFLCLDGTSMSENTIKLIFARLAKKAGVPSCTSTCCGTPSPPATL